jgi:hypothetical protein
MLIITTIFLFCTNLYLLKKYNRVRNNLKQVFIRSWEMESMLIYVANTMDDERSDVIKEFLDNVKPIT